MASPSESVAEDLRAFLLEQNRFADLEALLEEERDHLPGFVSSGDGRSVFFSKKMERLISRVAQKLKGDRPSVARSHTDREWHAAIRRSFGPALVALDAIEGQSESAAALLAAIVAAADDEAQRHGERDLSFGTTFLADSLFSELAIGPVLFEKRDTWLKRTLAGGNVSEVTGRRVCRIWAGDRLRKRKNATDRLVEQDILDTVGSCQFVCTVRTKGLGPETANSKAITAAHMALAAVSLMWQRPSAALSGFHLATDRGSWHRHVLHTVPPHCLSASRTRIGLPAAPTVTLDEWAAQYPAYRSSFDTLGRSIEYFLSRDATGDRSQMMNALALALLWFHEACREAFDVFAVVKFSASLDTLASGGSARGIRELIRNRTGIGEADPVFVGGAPMRNVVEEIYGVGRSRTIHGTNDRFVEDWGQVREQAEKLTRLCLLACVSWITKHPDCSAPLMLRKATALHE